MKNWIWWMIAGVISLIGGILALVNPFVATLTATMFAAWAFLLVGIIMLVAAFKIDGTGARIGAILLGILMLVFGISLIADPLSGVVSLTILAGVMLLLFGIIRFALAFSTNISSLRWAMILSGALSIILGIMIFTNFPQSAAVVLGIFLAVELISNGISLIVLSASVKANATY